jgi:NADPH:quinone reductase-like Zn-dependent oxidoreductase
MPNTPGADVVGRLYRVEFDCFRRMTPGLKVGDRVLSLTKWGGNARFLSVEPGHLVKVPEIVDPAEAACIAETYLAAFQILHFGQSTGVRYRKSSLSRQTFLVLGTMTANMGRALAELSKAAGCDTVFAAAKPKHHQQLSALGIFPLGEEAIDWWERLHGRIDALISFGQDVLPLHYNLLKSTGEVVVVANRKVHVAPDTRRPSTGLICSTDTRRPSSGLICSKSQSQQRSRTNYYDVYKEWEIDVEKCKRDLSHLLKLLEDRALRPHVLDRVPLHKVARAQDLVESKRLSGFLVCEPWLKIKSRAVQL